MQPLMDSPAFKIYAVSAAIVAIQMLLLALWTGTVRKRRGVFVNPEDAAGSKTAKADQDHEDVLRVKRAHQNLIENAVPFFVVGLLYVLTGATRTGAIAYFATFTAARLLHTLFYLWGKQPFRTITFAAGVLATLGMAVHVIRVSI